MKPNAIFLLLGVLGLYACGGGGNASGELPEPITLQADSIAVEQILAPKQIAVRGDVALILSEKTDTVFYAYGCRISGFFTSRVSSDKVRTISPILRSVPILPTVFLRSVRS